MIGTNLASVYQQPMEAVIAALGSDATQGLTTAAYSGCVN
jgi:hypothetical protein